MKNLLHAILAKILGRNLRATPAATIIDQLNEPRPLPMGRVDFGDWSARIIAGALIPNESGKVFQTQDEDPTSDYAIHFQGQQFALANMLMHLGPTESHKPDAYFVHSLRKFAVNQVADTIRKELHEKAKARTAAKAADEAATKAVDEVKQE